MTYRVEILIDTTETERIYLEYPTVIPNRFSQEGDAIDWARERFMLGDFKVSPVEFCSNCGMEILNNKTGRPCGEHY